MSGKNPNERTPLQFALDYAAAGWPVFPIAPGSKVPAFPSAHPSGDPAAGRCQGECGRLGHGFKDATTDPALIRQWWRDDPRRNVGIATGAPGPDVLDIDVHEDGNGFAALGRIKRAGLAEGQQAIIRTPSTGMHLYYRGTGQGNGSIRAQHVDFRSHGGYVVAPPSSTPAGAYVVVQHRAGQHATLDWDEVRKVLEPEAVQRQRARAQTQQHSPRQPGRGDEERVDRLVQFVREGVPNDRNYRTFWAAREAQRYGVLDETAADRLADAAVAAGLRGGSVEARRCVDSGRQHGISDPGPGCQPAPGGGQRPFGPSRDRDGGREAAS